MESFKKLLHNFNFKFTRKFSFPNNRSVIQQTCRKHGNQIFTLGNNIKHYRFTLVQELCEEHLLNICNCNDHYFNPNGEEPFKIFVNNKIERRMQLHKIWFVDSENMFI